MYCAMRNPLQWLGRTALQGAVVYGNTARGQKKKTLLPISCALRLFSFGYLVTHVAILRCTAVMVKGNGPRRLTAVTCQHNGNAL